MMSLPPHEFGLNAAGPPPDQQRQPDHASPAADRGRAFELVLIGLVNANRDQNHLTPVQLDDELSRLARIRATQEQGRPLGNLDEIAQVEIGALVVSSAGRFVWYAENLARVRGDDYWAATRVFRALILHPTHRQTILEPLFDRIGIGTARDPDGNTTVVVLMAEVR